eukprot:11900694-Karenia_brevis.AAC.1
MWVELTRPKLPVDPVLGRLPEDLAATTNIGRGKGKAKAKAKAKGKGLLTFCGPLLPFGVY